MLGKCAWQDETADQPAGAVSETGLARSVAVSDREAYPFCLPFLRDDFEAELRSRRSRSSWARTVPANPPCWKASPCSPDTTRPAAAKAIGRSIIRARRGDGRELSDALRASWLPKITNGWFFRAESFFSVARYLDEAGTPVARLPLAFARRGILRFFEERCQRQGIFIFDEPESALSPSRQIEFLKLMRRMDEIGHCQIIMATHSPMLMAYPNARLLRLTKYGLEPVTVKDTDHYKVMREFCDDPAGFVEAAIEE